MKLRNVSVDVSLELEWAIRYSWL